MDGGSPRGKRGGGLTDGNWVINSSVLLSPSGIDRLISPSGMRMSVKRAHGHRKSACSGASTTISSKKRSQDICGGAAVLTVEVAAASGKSWVGGR